MGHKRMKYLQKKTTFILSAKSESELFYLKKYLFKDNTCNVSISSSEMSSTLYLFMYIFINQKLTYVIYLFIYYL